MAPKCQTRPVFGFGSYTTRVTHVNTGRVMSATHELMDRVKERLGLKSDAALGRHLGLSQAAVSNWRQGTRHPQPHVIEKMALALNEPAINWGLRIQAERDKDVDPTNAKVWLRWAQAVSTTAAGVALAFGLAVYTPNSHAATAQPNFAKSWDYVYYVKSSSALRTASGCGHDVWAKGAKSLRTSRRQIWATSSSVQLVCAGPRRRPGMLGHTHLSAQLQSGPHV
jgi:transcriptional regulator with XRE-family HTH domain